MKVIPTSYFTLSTDGATVKMVDLNGNYTILDRDAVKELYKALKESISDKR